MSELSERLFCELKPFNRTYLSQTRNHLIWRTSEVQIICISLKSSHLRVRGVVTDTNDWNLRECMVEGGGRVGVRGVWVGVEGWGGGIGVSEGGGWCV